jgi:chemotaxis protein CheD
MASSREVHVNVAEHAVAPGDAVLTTTGLGSCVAIALYDASACLGAMAHVLLPHESLSRERGRPAKYSSTAVPFLVDELRRHGGSGEAPVAKLVGGSSMFGALLKTGGVNMGDRNVESARAALAEAGIRIVAEDVGGDYGRSVYFDVRTGDIRVVSIRNGERVI